MSKGTEITEAAAYLDSTMRGDTGPSGVSTLAAGGIFNGAADLDVTDPYVSYRHLGGADKRTQNGFKIFTRLLFLIESVGPVDSYDAVASLAGAVDALFDLVRQTSNSTAYIYSVSREAPIERYETVSGVRKVRTGGLYRVIASKK